MMTIVQGKTSLMGLRVQPGKPYPLGASWDGAGVNFAVYAPYATAVKICLFESAKSRAEMCPSVLLPSESDGIWHGYFPSLKPGQIYGLRVEGPYDPHLGHRFNGNKVLLDPYAKAVVRTNPLKWHDTLYGYKVGRGHFVPDSRDNSPLAPLGVVVDDAFTWGEDVRPNIPWNQTLIYEAHVKGMTMQHPDVPPELRGTYAGLASEPMIKHLKYLGVTAIELLPVYAFINEKHLYDKALTNYWGYNPLSFFALHPSYAYAQDPLEQLREFKTMVRQFHKAGIEVLLDVVYNHTAEGNQDGPTFSLKGIDNRAYYALNPAHHEWYMDFTGCGNSLNGVHPATIQLVMDSLRYWVEEMHVDGFRFDLAPILGRKLTHYDPRGPLLSAIQQDPILSKVKLIAEPWDVGQNGYQVGNFPKRWREWNDRYRDEIRQFWNFEGVAPNQFATVLAGSSDRFQFPGKGPTNSINFITCHDGFTLRDVVSYNYKHNEANQENNADGCNNNRSFNYGVEGETTDEAIQAVRLRQCRNMMATLFLSFGVPMILGGDELGKTQHGNNNTYCQDNALNWLDWDLSDSEKQKFLAFVANLSKLRRTYTAFRRDEFFKGHANPLGGLADIVWMTPEGYQVTMDDWHSPNRRCMGVLIEGATVKTRADDTDLDVADTLFYVINAFPSATLFEMPYHRKQGAWEMILTTSQPDGIPATLEEREVLAGGKPFLAPARSFSIFRLNI
jgi:isoamylase